MTHNDKHWKSDISRAKRVKKQPFTIETSTMCKIIFRKEEYSRLRKAWKKRTQWKCEIEVSILAFNSLKTGINTSTDFVNLPSVIMQAISSIRSTSIFKPAEQQTEWDKTTYPSMSLYPVQSDEFNNKKSIHLDESY